MNFSTPEKVIAAIRAGDQAEATRASNRTKVLDAANFKPPLSEDDAKLMQVKTNTNFGELPITLSHARMQLLSAFLGSPNFFTVKIPLAPVEYRSDWEATITEEINKILRESREYFELHRNRWNSVVLHGIGPMTWRHSEKWLPQFVALNDLRIPTDTTLDFKNLCWYAQRICYTPIELVKEVSKKSANNHWDKKAIGKILQAYKELNFTDAQSNYSWETDFEKLAGLMKQNGMYYGSDAVPTISLYHFYFEDEGKWYMCVVPDANVKGAEKGSTEFLWKSDKPIADTWHHLIHCQFGDLSSDTPYNFHAVRGLGFALLEPTFYSNLLKCRMLDHINDNLNTWLRVQDSSEKARSAMQEFGNFKVISKGVSVVPANERHQIDAPMLELGMSQMKQLQGEASTSYTQQSDTGTSKEQTAYETQVKLEQVNALMGGIQLVAFTYEGYADREICRRFCIPNSTDKDVKDFQEKMRKKGIPKMYLDVKLWQVDPVTPLGRGNPTIALSMAQQLYAIKGDLPPESQNKVLHDYVLAITKDPARASDLVPLKTQEPSDATQLAADRFGALMQGVPMPIRNRNIIDQIDTLMPLMAGKIMMITQRDNMATVEEGQGLANTSQHISELIAQLSQDQQQKPRVKQYTDGMGRLTNEIKGLIQRGEQKRQADAKKAQDGENAAEMAKAQATIQLAQAKIQLGEQQAQSKLQQQQIKDAHDLTAKQVAAEADEKRKNEAARADLVREGYAAKAELDRQNEAAKHDIARENAKTSADIANSKKVAASKASLENKEGTFAEGT